MDADTSQSQAPSQDLPDEVIAAVASLVVSRTYEAGETIVQRGDQGTALYIVRVGAAEVVMRDEEGFSIPLARFGPGSYFGEMSLLTGDPVSADVVAVEKTVCSVLSSEDVDRVLASVPALGRHFAVTLANRLRQANLSIWDVHRRQHALGQFLKRGHEEAVIVGQSRQAQSLRDRVQELAQQGGPALIVGEDGVGKTMVARCLHAGSAHGTGPLIAVDCSSVADDEARELLFGSSDPAAVGRYAQRLGYVHLAEGGTLLLERIEDLPPEVQADLVGFLAGPRGEPTDGPAVDEQIIATSRLSPEGLERSEDFDPALAAPLTERVIEVPPLRKRKRDIAPLADHFLAAHAAAQRQEPKGLTRDALRLLLAGDYTYGNVGELKEGLERAAQLSDAQSIGVEHIFLGPQGTRERGQYDLFDLEWLSSAAHSGRVLRLLQGAVFAIFVVITATCLVAPGTRGAGYANAAVWSIWWPLLLLSMLPAGRFWCALCPISYLGALAQRVKCLNLAPPQWMKLAGPVAVLTGFVGIVWVEYAADMHRHAFATGLLLLTLMALAAAVGLVFQRHSWCRYLCPLGGLGATVSMCACVRVRASRDVCATQCTQPYCYKGSDDSPGCPVFHHALFVDNSHHCKLCLECLRACPHGSVRLFVQGPLRDLWTAGRISPLTAAFSVTLTGVALVLALSRWTGLPDISLTTVPEFSAGVVVSLGLGLLALVLFARLQEGPWSEQTSLWARLCVAFAPLAWAVLLCYHLGTSQLLRDLMVALGLATRGTAVETSLLGLLYLAAVALGVVLTAGAFWRLHAHRFRSAPLGSQLAWAACALLATLYGVVGFGSYLRGVFHV
ncbi:MAG: sigma 54-interacting transcriptional regulator [Armatimonadota bacterium]